MLFVHIGMNKAGSSTIQAFLRQNAARLAERGVLYPEIGAGAVAHHGLADALSGDDPAGAWAEVARLAGQTTVVISSERLGHLPPERLAMALGPVRPRILCWQRDACEGVVSRYAQQTKNGKNLRSFADFLAHGAFEEHLLIAPLLARWAEVFGAEAIRVRSLDAGVLAGGELVSDLLDALGLEDEPALVRPERQNVSPGWRALETIRMLNRDVRAVGRPDERAERFLRKAMPKAVSRAAAALGLDARGAYLDAAQTADLVDRYNADVAALHASGMDARLAPASAVGRPVATTPLTEASIPPEDAARLMRAAMAQLAAEDFRTWR